MKRAVFACWALGALAPVGWSREPTEDPDQKVETGATPLPVLETPTDRTPEAVNDPDLAPDPPPKGDREPPTQRRPKIPVKFQAHGHVKSMGLMMIPYKSALFPSTLPTGQGMVDARLTLSLDVGKWLYVEAAHDITATLGSSNALAASPLQSGVGRTAPEAMPLTWHAPQKSGGSFFVQGRTDRLLIRGHLGPVDVTLGRQPISFGSGKLFTPIDLVSPFTPTQFDMQYKPGVDALRIDGFIGTSGKVTALASYAGSWDERGMTAVAYGQGTVGVSDLGLFYGFVQGDHVVGVSVASSAGPVGLYGDAAVTIPRKDLGEPVFGRVVAGLDYKPTRTTTLMAEVYVQSIGQKNATGLLQTFQSERFARSEIWLAGIAYAGVVLSQDITPIVHASLSTIVNLTEPSALLAPSLQWDIANSADLLFGGYVGLGKRPADRTPTLDNLIPVEPRSEFGTYPAMLFLTVRAYF